jgi:hypothetical protein
MTELDEAWVEEQLPAWRQLNFRVYVCLALGEDPEDHGLTLEEVDFMCYWIFDNDNECRGFMHKGAFIFPLGHREVFRV